MTSYLETRSAARRRALTLIEIMVAMALLGLLTTATLTMFIPTLDRYASADTTYDAQRNALAGARMLAVDLKESQYHLLEYTPPSANPITLQMVPAGTRLAIPTARDAAGNYQINSTPYYPNDYGTPGWQGWIIYSCVPDTSAAGACKLLRQQVSGPVPAFAGWDPLRNTNPNVGTLVSAGVSALTVSLQASAGGRATGVVQLQTLRLLHDRSTTFEGDATIDMHY